MQSATAESNPKSNEQKNIKDVEETAVLKRNVMMNMNRVSILGRFFGKNQKALTAFVVFLLFYIFKRRN
jgi:hypothetical protein